MNNITMDFIELGVLILLFLGLLIFNKKARAILIRVFTTPIKTGEWMLETSSGEITFMTDEEYSEYLKEK